jgi:uncharacterized membrane protein
MTLLLLIAVVVLVILTALALSQASDVNKRLNAYVRELGRIQALQWRLDLLERELKRLRSGRSVIAEPPPGGIATGGTDQEAGLAIPPAARTAAAIASGEQIAPSTPPPSGAELSEREGPPVIPWPTHPPKPSRSRAEWEAFVGGKLLNRIGAFALIVGVGFFLKYAFDNEWISESVRVLIGAATGLTCLAVAHRARRKGMSIFAQGLVGSGVAILYLSVYASFNYYHLVSQPVAFLLMAVVTTLTFAQGVAHGSLAVGLLGWAGGFLTPFLLSTGEPNETGLFGYVAVLDVAILALAYRKRDWDVLAPLSMTATWIVCSLWHLEYFAPEKLGVAIFFFSLFWLLFHAADVAAGSRTSIRWPQVRHLLPTVSLGIFYVLLYDILEREHHEWTAPATLILAGMYLATALAGRRDDPRAGADRARNLLTLATLVVVATAVQYAGFTTVILWSAEAALLAYCGIRLKYDYLLPSAVILFFVAGVKFAGMDGTFQYPFPGEFGPITNVRSLAYLVYAAALAVGARQYRKSSEPSAPVFAAWLSSLSAIAVFVGLTVTVNDVFSFAQSHQDPGPGYDLMFRRLMAIACTWTVYSIPFVWAGLSSNRSTLLIPGLAAILLAVTLVTIRGAAFHPIEVFHVVFNTRVAAFVIVLCAMAVHSALIDTYRGVRDWLPDLRSYLGLGAGVAFFALLTGETRDIFEKLLSDQPHAGAPGFDGALVVRLRNLQQLSISGVRLAYSVVLLAFGIWKGSKGLRFFSIGVFGLSILKIFVYDLSFLETLYRIFSFIGLGMILLAVSYAYQRFKGLLFGDQATGGPEPRDTPPDQQPR